VKPNTGAGENKKKIKENTQTIICNPVKPNNGTGGNKKRKENETNHLMKPNTGTGGDKKGKKVKGHPIVLTSSHPSAESAPSRLVPPHRSSEMIQPRRKSTIKLKSATSAPPFLAHDMTEEL
jgi:hypothetical protein